MPRLSAQGVERVVAASVLLAPTQEPIGELLAVVSQEGAEGEQPGLVGGMEEGSRGRGGLVAFDGDEYPTRGAVDRHEDVAAGLLVGHL